MKRFTIKKWLTKKAIAFGLVVVTAALIAGVAMAASNNAAHADANTSDTTYCGEQSDNSVIYGGICSMSQLQSDYNSNVQGIQTVYASKPFYMSSSAMNDFFSHYQVGEVYSQADGSIPANSVVVDGQVVGTNAVTAGREPMSCDLYSDSSGGTPYLYVRQPTCSFISSPLQAYVYMPGGVFRFAVLVSCGNPVVAAPVLPVLQCNELQATDESTELNSYTVGNVHIQYTASHGASFGSVTYDWGDGSKSTFGNDNPQSHTYNTYGTYKVTVSALTGTANGSQINGTGLSNCTFTVNFPKPEVECVSLTYDTIGQADVNGNQEYRLTAKASASSGAKVTDYQFNFHDGTPIDVIKTSNLEESVTHTYAPGSHTAADDIDFTDKGQTFNASCSVKLTVPPAPIYVCSDLVLSDVTNEQKTVKATVSYEGKNGAKFKSATFKWGKGIPTTTVSSNSATHTYTSYGKYVVSADVTFDVNGTDKTVSAAACEGKSITFSAPSTPEYACTELTVTPSTTESLTVTAVTKYTEKNGATFKSVTYDFGDDSNVAPITKETNNKVTATHTYATYGTYTITSSVTFEVKGKDVTVSAPDCVSQVNFPAPTPMCTVPGETTLPASSASCVTPSAPTGSSTGSTTALVNTGPGDVFAVMGVASVLGTIGHYIYRARKLGRSLF